jgi:energy-coupling factor transporter ATP-binding protein EcfA2
VIEIRGLTKRYGDRTAVDDLTVTIHPGRVTGFLGPNGAGKSTTMRVVVGLDRPTAGTGSPPSTSTSTPSRRCGPGPAPSCSRTPSRPSCCARSGPSPGATRWLPLG